MLYLSGMFALNLECSLETCGDWHRSAMDWSKARSAFRQSYDSVFDDYGVESRKPPTPLRKYFDMPEINQANHIRACLDLIEEGSFSLVQGMRKDFIVVSMYDYEIFDKILLLRDSPSWEKVNWFMHKEYARKWMSYKEEADGYAMAR